LPAGLPANAQRMGMLMDDETRLALYRAQFRQHGHLTLSRANFEWLFRQAELGIEAKGRVFLDTTDMPECVVLAHASPPPRRRRTVDHGPSGSR
jgi:hypothetical protein